jgi:hypothetical protein
LRDAGVVPILLTFSGPRDQFSRFTRENMSAFADTRAAAE